jgi:hypothetical protein
MVEERASQVTLPVTGIVIAFRPRRSERRRMRSRAAEIAEHPAPCIIRSYESTDIALNAAWDRLLTLVLEAWCWRDPDCLASVKDCVAELRRAVDHDWS